MPAGGVLAGDGVTNLRGTPRVPSDAPVVRLYSRPGCHLCEVGRTLLLAIQRTFPFQLELVNIEGDAELERRFLLEIPVVEVAGEVVCTGQVNVEAVRAAVNHARIASARRSATGDA